jgi:hypothetical protein
MIRKIRQEHGPSALPNGIRLNPASTFGLEGYFALLGGMNVPVARPYRPTESERTAWRAHLKTLGTEAANGCGMRESLAALRGERQAHSSVSRHNDVVSTLANPTLAPSAV